MINVLIPLVIRSEQRKYQQWMEAKDQKTQTQNVTPERVSQVEEKLRIRSSSLPPSLATFSSSRFVSSLSSTISSLSFLPSFSPSPTTAPIIKAKPVPASASFASPREEEAIKELVLKLIDLILSGVMERSNGWKEVEQMRYFFFLLLAF